MTEKRKALQEDMRFRVLRALEDKPDMSQRDLARHLGVSVGQTHYQLRALAEKGFIKIRNFSNSRNKMNYSYLLTKRGVSEKMALTQRFLERKRLEYELLKDEISSLEEEMALGANMAPRGVVDE
nr:MarR family EPS-associated transcriptional regulator [uncultured Celeribacter sp.]